MKKRIVFGLLALLLSFSFLLTSCDEVDVEIPQIPAIPVNPPVNPPVTPPETGTFVAVTNITSVFVLTIQAGGSIPLDGTVEPGTATNKTIVWSLASAGTTGASLTGNMLSVPNAGTVKVTATVVNGLTESSNYTKDFDIVVSEEEGNQFTAVTDINGTFALNGVSGTPITLGGTALPNEATNKAPINWSETNRASTISSVVIDGNTLTVIGSGNVTVTGTIANGAAEGTPYTKPFTINFFAPVTGIDGVTSGAAEGAPILLTGSVEPSYATNQAITWSLVSAGTTGSSLNGSTLTAPTNAGTIRVKATIVNGLAAGSNYEEEFNIVVTSDFVAVTSITRNFAETGITGTAIPLNVSVVPGNATNTSIGWSVLTQGGTGSVISNNSLTASNAGVVTIRASITGGGAGRVDFTADFNVTITQAFVAITNISGVATSGVVGTPLTLNGTINPSHANAFGTAITWSVQSAGSTGATISGNTLTATNSGTVTVRAAVANGLTATTPYTQDFNITIAPAQVSNPRIIPVSAAPVRDAAPSTVSINMGSGAHYTAGPGLSASGQQ